MSLWTSPLPSLVLGLLLTDVVMRSGCNAASATADPRPAKINSIKEMRITIAQITQRLQRAERSLAPLKASTTDLDRKFNSYSARSAHHDWASANQQQSTAKGIRQDAHVLRSQLRMVDRVVRSQFGPQVARLQSPSLRRFARDAPTKLQLAQSAKIYKRILELLQNMIECPVHILQFLEDNSSESDGVESDSVEPEEDEEEGADAGYGYQYYN